MRQRIYFLLPDLDTARSILNELLLARIEERHIHYMAKDGISLEGLHEASLLQKSDIAHGAEAGLLIGGVTGVLAGVMVLLFPLTGMSPQLITVLVTALVGAAFGAWVSSMVACAVPNSRLRAFQKGLDQGKILVMVDVPKGRVGEIHDLIEKRHPEATSGGMEPTIPAFP